MKDGFEMVVVIEVRHAGETIGYMSGALRTDDEPHIESSIAGRYWESEVSQFLYMLRKLANTVGIPKLTQGETDDKITD